MIFVEEKEIYGIIYMVRNKINDKKYIGQTINSFKERYRGNLEKYTENEHLRNSIKKYGIENFEIIEVFDIAHDKCELDELEKYYINYYKTYEEEYGYNKTLGGEGGIPNEQARESMRKAKQRYKEDNESQGTAYWQNPEFIELMSSVTSGEKNGMYGKKHTEETKRKISENKKGKLVGENSPHWGKPKSEETRKKISLSRKGKYTGADNHMYGKTLSEENRRKIAESNRRRSGANSSVAKKVKCVNTDEVFVSATEASKHFGLKGDYVARVARGERKSVKHPTTGEKLIFVYI